MGRSVATPYNAEWSLFIPFECDDPDDAPWEWDDYVDYLTGLLLEQFPTSVDLRMFNKWIDQECRAIAGNGLGTFYLAEYGSLTSLSFVADSDREALAARWATQAKAKLEKALAGRLLRHIATASNGEAFFERIAAN